MKLLPAIALVVLLCPQAVQSYRQNLQGQEAGQLEIPLEKYILETLGNIVF